MPTIDFYGSAYSDAARAGTLKAMQQRRLEREKQTLQAMQPATVASLPQGLAHLTDVLGSSIREARAANDEKAGRQRFAELMAGGLTPDEMGEAYSLDPDVAGKYQEHTWATEKEAREAAARKAELEQSHGWDVDAANRLVETNRLAREDEARIAEEKAKADQERERQQGATRRITGAEAEAKGGDPTKVYDYSDFTNALTEVVPSKQTRTLTGEEVKALIDKGVKLDPNVAYEQDETGNINRLDQSSTVGQPSVKEIYDAQDKLGVIDSKMDDLNRALELNDSVIQGPVGKGASELLGWDPTGLAEGVIGPEMTQRINNTKEFYTLMSAGAMTRMAEELKGSTAYQELLHYQELFASPTATVEVRRNALNGMLNTLKKHRAVNAARLKAYGAGEQKEYVYTPRTAAGGTTEQPTQELSDEDLVKKYSGGR